jgi:arylsulfatase A-like enzyme/Flp pilus assembly protein TadD
MAAPAKNNSQAAPRRRVQWRRLIFPLAIAAAMMVLGIVLFGPTGKRQLHERKLQGCNVILITLDTTRADHLSCYDAEHVQTPNLDALAAAGTIFDRCISQAPLTLPAHTTILSGSYPAFHQVRDNGSFVVPEGLELLSETLRRRGFATSAFISAYVLHRKWGLNRGWDYYGDSFRFNKLKTISLSNIQKLAGDVLPEAEAWLEKNGKQRFFSWIHLYDPHSPYTPPEPFASLYRSNPYQGEVAYMDAELGKFFSFLKARGLWDNTLIVVAGDHGEMLGEHGEDAHGLFIYEAAVHVPLIVRSPWRLPARRVATTVELVDVMPTILEALGIAPGKTQQGKSLLRLAFGEESKGFGQALCETWYPRLHYGWSELTAIYKDGYKFIEAPQEELYDLANGGVAEDDNLWLKKSAIGKKMKKNLHDFQARIARGSFSSTTPAALSREDRQKLAALGYLSTVVEPTEKIGLTDPKTKIKVYNDITRVREMEQDGRIGQAIILMNEILARDPEIVDGRSLLGNLYYKERRFPEALAAYRQVIRQKANSNFAMVDVVNTLMAMKQLDQAEKEIHAFRAIFPKDATFLRLLGQVAEQRQRPDEALAWFQKALILDPKYAEVYLKMGEIYFQSQDLAGAEKCLAKAQEINPDLSKVAFIRAQVADASGDLELARKSYLRELEINEKNVSAAFNLAQVCKKLGRMDEALRFFRMTTEIDPGFNLPFFIIARTSFDRRQNLDEAIAMCRRGVAIQPADKNTPLGYFLLSDIYAYLGDDVKARENFALGQRALAPFLDAPR